MRKKLWERNNDLHGHNENEKTPGEKANFLLPAFSVCRKSIFDKLRMEVS